MALNKRTYGYANTKITSQNLNDIQDAIIALETVNSVDISTSFGSRATAKKSGNVATLAINVPDNEPVTSPSAGWVSIGTLPATLRPSGTIYGNCYDNNAATYSVNTVLDFRITTGGSVDFYLFADKLSIVPKGTITYIV